MSPPTFARIFRPYGAVAAIDEPDGLDLLALKAKSIAWHLRAAHSVVDSGRAIGKVVVTV